MTQPTTFQSVSILVDHIIEERGRSIRLGLPLGIGKAYHIANELTERALRGELEQLTIYTALSLQVPAPSSLLEKRLMEPIVDRLYSEYPGLRYAELRARGELPSNIRVHEFYYAAGSLLGHPPAQRDYVSINYTEIFRLALNARLDVFAQMVAPGHEGGYDLGGNTDVSLDLFPKLREQEQAPILIAEVNEKLPSIGGAAELPKDTFDLVLEGQASHEPFSRPSLPPTDAEYATGVRVASLLRDGGTIQLGIGNLGDAAAWATIARNESQDVFLRLSDALPASPAERTLRTEFGGDAPFDEGLYGCTEMLTEGLLNLFLRGVIRREVDEGVAMHAGFFLGSPAFYEAIRNLSEEQRAQIQMSSVRWTNLLYGDEETKRRQRRHGRFMNEGMMVTLLGSVVSDQLADGRVVSGVGGQFEFVSMANSLEDGRSIIMIPATRESQGKVTSNIVWNYAHTTIPRHLRDIVVTEYGVADLRDQPDGIVIQRLIEIADSRFQGDLIETAVEAGKLDPEYEIPDWARTNTPEKISAQLRPFRENGDIPRCPFGSSLTEVELNLVDALQYLRGVVDTASGGRVPDLDMEGLREAFSIPEAAEPYLRRMGLQEPENAKERAFRRLLVYALSSCGFV